MQNGWATTPNYGALCRGVLGSDVETVDFRSPASSERINHWASDRTHGLIPSLVTPDQIDQAKLVLTNAIYFKGKWESAFDATDTQRKDFTESDGLTSTTPTMHQVGGEGYFETGLYQFAELPFGYGRWQCVIILPKRGKTVDEALTSLGGAGLYAAPKSCKDTLLDLSLPKFEVDGDYELDPQLSAKLSA